MIKKFGIISFFIILFFIVLTGCRANFCTPEEIEAIRDKIRLEYGDTWRQEAENSGKDVEDYIEKKLDEEYAKYPQACLTTDEREIEVIPGKDYTRILLTAKDWSYAFSKGFLSGVLVFPIATVLIFLFNAFGAKGFSSILSIMIVTFILKGGLLIATRKMTLQGQKMQILKPEIDKIKAKYPGNTVQSRQKIQVETMKYYQEHGLLGKFMLGMLAQLILTPIVFLSVYSALRNTTVLNRGEFLGISLGQSMSQQIGDGNFLALAIFILFVLTQFASIFLPQIFSNKIAKEKGIYNSKSQQQQKTMRIMFIMMTVMFAIFAYSSVFTLTVYWLFSGFLTIIQTILFRQKLEKDKTIVHSARLK